MNWLKQLYTAITLIIVFALVTGVIYPLVITGLAQVMFKDKANGSLIIKDGKLLGSHLIGQSFTSPQYFYSRPSAAGVGYDATSSSGTNWGPTNQLLHNRVKAQKETLQNHIQAIPVDLVTASASGLDPHITPAAANFQITRIAEVRQTSEQQIKALVSKHTENRQLGVLGEPRVNVLELNLDLDTTYPIKNQ